MYLQEIRKQTFQMRVMISLKKISFFLSNNVLYFTKSSILSMSRDKQLLEGTQFILPGFSLLLNHKNDSPQSFLYRRLLHFITVTAF
uniref:Alternative protein TIA1 n=1 Tax=Homo sapiens TaxID=9606 RepID=L8E940_HUMAN|nr:alternative protein TIA1 [Homo sapiens]